MWAGAVAAPLRSTSAGSDSTISISRSVAVSFSLPLPASIRTFDRMGMVFRRSTTLWTWLSAFKKAPRSTVIFMGLVLGFCCFVCSSSAAQICPCGAAVNLLICLGFFEAIDSSKGVYQGWVRGYREKAGKGGVLGGNLGKLNGDWCPPPSHLQPERRAFLGRNSFVD